MSPRLQHYSGDTDAAEEPLLHLPPAEIRHWLPRHKAAVVAAVRSSTLTLEQALHRYMLTTEEFLTWRDTIDQYGVQGLKANPRERRKAARRSISERARLAIKESIEIDCIITNISDAGVRLRLASSPNLPATFDLHCSKSNRSWQMDLVWQNGRSVGLRFHNPLPKPWTIKSGLGEWLVGKRRTVCLERADAF